jgi:predicted metal-dependent phosphoesterase TrpH
MIAPYYGNGNGGHVDFHMHSTLSDGHLSVRDLIDYCVEQGLSAVSITDHDNIDAYIEGREYAEEAGIGFIPGVEISSSWQGHDIHMLGYLFEPTHLELNRTLVTLREKRRKRARRIVTRLAEKGIELSYDKLAARTQHGGSIGRAHIAAAMVEEEYVPTFQEAFVRYLGNGNPFMEGMESEKLTPGEAIGLIRDAGGVAVLAHPGRTNQDALIGSMVEQGLQGIETWCHSHTPSTHRRYKDVAKRYGLLCSGGADFHVRRDGDRFAPGSLRIPGEVLDKIRDAKAKG